MKKNLLNVTMLLLLSFMLKAQSGTHLNFDGDNDLVTTGTGISDYFAGKTAVTIEAVVRPESIKGISGTGLGVIAGNYNFPTSTNTMQFLLRRDNYDYNFWIHVAGSGYVNVNAQASVELNEWQHVAGVWDGSTASIYINGELKASREIVGVLNTVNNQFVIGTNAINEDFDGDIDEVRIWETVRSAEELCASKFVELSGTEPGLVAYYSFDNGMAGSDNTGLTTLEDKTGNGYNGVLTNFALNGSSSNWLGGSIVTSPAAIPSWDLTQGTGIIIPNPFNESDTRIAGKDNILYIAKIGSNPSIGVYETSNGVPEKINEVTGTDVLPTVGFTATSMKIIGDYIYMSSRAGDFGSFSIFDISNPSSPVFLSEVATRASYFLHVMGDTLITSNEFGKKASYYDISDKSNPVFIDNFTITLENTSVLADFSDTVMFADLGDSLVAYDVTDPNTVNKISTTRVFGGNPMVYKNALYLRSSDSILVYNITDPSSISYVTKVEAKGVVAYEVYEGKLYASQKNTTSYTKVFDLSNPLDPQLQYTQTKVVTGNEMNTYFTFGDFGFTDNGIYKIGGRGQSNATLAIFSYKKASTCPKVCYNGSFVSSGGQAFDDIVDDFSVTDTLVANNGLDSILTATVRVSAPVNVQLSVSGATLTLSNTAANYQWITCDDGAVISNENEQSFTAIETGEYAAIVSEDGCVDTTVCEMVVITSIVDETDFAELVELFPNPTNGGIYVKTSTDQGTLKLTVRNSLGAIVSLSIIQNTSNTQFLELGTTPGIYFVEVENKKGEFLAYKVVKN